MHSAFQRVAYPFRVFLLAGVCLAASSHVRVTWAQGYDVWSKVESAEETRVYTERHGEGAFDDAQKAVVERTILPQLDKPANRSTLPQVRLRMRDILTRGTTNPKIFDAANTATVAFMMSNFVKNESTDMAVRLNAMILIGELEAADQKAWPGAVDPLAKAAKDAALPLAIRVAAMAGLVRQVHDGRANEPAFASSVAPVVASIVTKPPQGDPRAVAWLITRALDMVPVVGATPEVMTAAAGILADAKADLDLRIRAAMALGLGVKPDATPDLTAAPEQIRELAKTALKSDIAAAEARRFAKQLSGGPDANGGLAAPPQPVATQPDAGGILGGGTFGTEAAGSGALGESGVAAVVDPEAIPPRACRRDAWRLMSLGDALQSGKTKGAGIASVLSGNAAADAIQLASILREQGSAIDAAPVEESVKTALAAIEAMPSAAPGQPAESPAVPGTGKPKDGPAASPFGGAEGSPF